MSSWCTWSTLYKGLLTLIVVLILLEYFYGSMQTKNWESVFNLSATRLPSTLKSVQQIHSPIFKFSGGNNDSKPLKTVFAGGDNTSSSFNPYPSPKVLKTYANDGNTTTNSTSNNSNSNNTSHGLLNFTSNAKVIFDQTTSVAAEVRNDSTEPRAKMNSTTVSPPCPDTPPGLMGRVPIVKNHVPTVQELEKRFSWLRSGGHWTPDGCRVEKTVAIIVPFRCRGEHLLVFLQHMHPFLKRQQVDYTIFIVEQNGNQPFNRAMLMNIGFKEALKLRDYDCFIFHDIDLLPEDDRNLYNCPIQPRHMSAAIDIFKYKLPYRAIFGGVSAMTREHFELLNGFSNLYWGWGGEDDDMSNRIKYHKLHISRYPLTIARYTMLQHKKDKPSPNRYDLLKNGNRRFKTEGLNSLVYSVRQLKQNLLYTWVLVQIDPPS